MSSSFISSKIRQILRQNTTWNVDVGLGVIPTKRVYRYPSPASQSQEIPLGKLNRFPAKAEPLGHIKYADKETRLLKYITEAPSSFSADPRVDSRNMFLHKFEDVPAPIPVRVAKWDFYQYNDAGSHVKAE
eukprot:TRINITY_DN1691_c0_g1_i1.p1 TRINITY_DN1691_c0_g1~~TRINITY_DN1691_c0_g1_i1.p1  ORF type:complete len:141 (+),score=9.90 TRINITY_DN1691_c0_g1_i1:32-424(+)